MKETYTSLETSRAMFGACPVETGMWWIYVVSSSVDFGEEYATRKDGWILSRAPWSSPDAKQYPAHSLSTAMHFLEVYGKKVGWERTVDFETDEATYYNDPLAEKQKDLLDAYIAGNYNMASKEVSEFIEEKCKK